MRTIDAICLRIRREYKRQDGGPRKGFTSWIESAHNGQQIQVDDILDKKKLSPRREKELESWWLENVTSICLPGKKQ